MARSLKQAKDELADLGRKGLQIVNDDRLDAGRKAAALNRLDAQIKAAADEVTKFEGVEANRRRYLGDFDPAVPWTEQAGTELSGLQAGLATRGMNPVAPPRLDLDEGDLHQLYQHAVQHKSFATDVRLKAPDLSTDLAPSTVPQIIARPVAYLREPNRVLTLLPTAATGAGSVEWFRISGTTAAGPVAEAATKPLSHIAATAVTTKATKLAHYVEVSDEVLSDFPSFLSVLQGDLSAGLINAENAELLSAVVGTASQWPGMLNTSGILTRPRGTDTALDAIDRAFDDLRNGAAFAEPDGIAMHPSTYGAIRRAKDTQGRYLLNPDPTAEAAHTLRGVPVVTSTQMPTGVALVAAFSQSVQVYVREGIRVEVANQGAAQFTANTTLVRCEERLILTCPRPAGLIKVTGL